MIQALLPPEGWRYEGIFGERRDLLMRRIAPGQLISQLLPGSELESVTPSELCEERDGNRIDARRVAFDLAFKRSAALNAADYLLNGSFGLRAAYAADPEMGRGLNRLICEAIARAVVEKQVPFSSQTSAANRLESLERVKFSLYRPSAKIWYDVATDRSPARPDEGTVDCYQWQMTRANQQGLSARLGLGEQQIQSSMAKGMCVPRPNKLNVKGAFVDAAGTEFVVLSKRNRDLQIHLLGWT